LRPTKIQNYMDIASTVALRSHDAETKVGAILVNNKSGAIISTGYNGFIKGTNDLVLPNTRPDKYVFILHAEENLITNCARHGLAMEDSFLVCTLSPCQRCMRLMINSGITKVVAKTLYKDFPEIMKMKDVEVYCSETPEGFYDINYSPKGFSESNNA